jgi:uncharacterized protein YdaU (DUF1376 family)
MPDPMLSPLMVGSRDFRLEFLRILLHGCVSQFTFRAWFLRSPAGAAEGETAVAAAYASYRKAYAQQALTAFFRIHCREEWLQKRCYEC